MDYWKLIELLNEREIGEEWWELYYFSNGVIRDDWWNILYSYRIISNEFWFIKWLVENDKIDLLQLDNRIALSEFNKVERVLMALSISDTPIEDLISILKNV